jgi:hypothetical protein
VVREFSAIYRDSRKNRKFSAGRSNQSKEKNNMPEKTDNTQMKNRCPNCGEVVVVDTGMVGEMATCPNEECGKVFRVSIPDGKPVSQEQTDPERTHSIKEDDGANLVSDEELLYTVHPAFVRRRPLKSIVTFVVGIVGLYIMAVWGGMSLIEGSREFVTNSLSEEWMPWIGGILFLVALLFFLGWWISALFTTLKVTNKRTTYREGIIAKETSEVLHEDVRNLQIDQSVWERLLFIGDIALSSSGQDDLEIEAHAIPSPDRIAKVIRQYQ